MQINLEKSEILERVKRRLVQMIISLIFSLPLKLAAAYFSYRIVLHFGSSLSSNHVLAILVAYIVFSNTNFKIEHEK